MSIDLEYTPPRKHYYEGLVDNQKVALVPEFKLECGQTLTSVPVAYKTWGKLNESRNNVLVLCHALSGSSDAEDWWRPLMGPGKAFDYNRFFLFCGNMLGSPYGSASPLTTNPATGNPYGPEFPETTIRDDVRVHKLVLDAMGVKGVAAVIGGSLGGMAALEWPLCTPPGYVRTIVPITTSSYQSAWSIAWNEAQKEAIRADGEFNHGWYTPVPSGQPRRGLGAARMVGMLTYRSYQSFEARFHRKPASSRYPAKPTPVESETGLPTPSPSDKGSVDGEAYSKIPARTVPKYSAQSYMQYQAEKFLKRFDANCYINLLDKMDSHDVTRDRLSAETGRSEMGPSFEELKQVLSAIPPRALVISVETDVLFRNEHQIELAQCLPEARFINLDSDDGHDGFLLEFEALSMLIGQHLRQEVPWVYESNLETEQTLGPTEVIASVFGEAEPEF